MNDFVNRFPYSDVHELNLDWCIKAVKQVYTDMENFKQVNMITFSDPIAWDITKQYPAFTIVSDMLNKRSYMSKKPVPVGINIKNEEYWEFIGDFILDFELNPASVNPIANRPVALKFNSVDNSIELVREDLTTEKLAREAADSALTSSLNTVSTTLNAEVSNRAAADALLGARIDEILEGASVDPDAELLDIRVGADGVTYDSAGDAVRHMDSYIQNSTFPALGLSWIADCYINDDGSIRVGGIARQVSEFVPCRENETVYYRAESNHSTILGIAFYDINKKFILGYHQNGADNTDLSVTSPAKAAFCRISTKDAYVETSYVYVPNGSVSEDIYQVAKLAQKTKTAFVATTGNDSTGDGSSSYPFATVNKALQSGADNVLIKGGRYFQTIDINNAKSDKISISAYDPTKKVTFLHPDSFCASSASAVEGYTRVYKFPYTASIYSGIRLYQEGIPDNDTLITDEERNPYQRGQEYRCDDTKIIPCTSDNLSDACSEIESSVGYKYFYDTDEHYIYFSSPETVSGTYPIMRSIHPGYMIYNPSRKYQVDFNGIEVKYMRFNVNTLIANLTDCKAANVFGAGGFTYDQAIVKFVRCESSGTYYAGGAGDGFNAHSTKTDDAFAKQTTAMIIDCWSHDSQDDGYSDHERSETEIYGGLFEYNGKAGITPSYGSHCSCYGVISRKNYAGFYYLGEVAVDEGGKYGQLLCVDCLAENNTRDAGSGYGFAVNHAGNKIILINCKSIGNIIGYYAFADTRMELTDCRSLNDSTVKYASDSATVNIRNTNIVS